MTSKVRLIAQREIVSRWQQKGYRISLGVTLLIAVVAVIIPSFFSSDSEPATYDIGVLVAQPSGLPPALTALGKIRGVHVRVDSVGSAAGARTKVSDGDWDAAIVPGPTIVVQSAGSDTVDLIRDAFVQAETAQSLPARSTLQGGGPLPTVEATKSSDDTQRETLAIITVVVLFSQLIAFCTWVATGVVEEKASRVVELLLSSVRPVQLLAGKLLGIGALAAAQVAALGGAAVLAATSAGTLTLPASDLLTVLISYVAFLLGFVFFSAVSAALASTVSRQEEVSGVLAPVSMVLTLCYVASFFVAANGSSTFGRVLSIVPPVSCIAMPARIARGQATAVDVVSAVALLVVVSAAALVLAGRIYRVSVLHTGARLKLGQAWRGEQVAATPR